MSKNSNRKLKFGEPEHIISAERARDVIKQKILFKPETDNAHDITQGVIPRNENGKFDKHAFSDTYNLDAADINSAAELLSDKVVTTLEGNGKFTRFTAESLASVDTTILSKMGDPDVSNSLSSLPASNGKTFTSVQMMRAAEKFLSEDEFKSTCNYVVNDARFEKVNSLIQRVLRICRVTLMLLKQHSMNYLMIRRMPLSISTKIVVTRHC